MRRKKPSKCVKVKFLPFRGQLRKELFAVRLSNISINLSMFLSIYLSFYVSIYLCIYPSSCYLGTESVGMTVPGEDQGWTLFLNWLHRDLNPHLKGINTRLNFIPALDYDKTHSNS